MKKLKAFIRKHQKALKIAALSAAGTAATVGSFIVGYEASNNQWLDVLKKKD